MSTDDEALLEGVRVLEIAHPLTEHAGRIFASLGAEVLLLETPRGADTRRRAPYVRNATPGSTRSSIPFLARNLNKSGLTLAMDAPGAKDQLAGLVQRCDLVLDADGSDFHPHLGDIPGDAPRITITDERGLGTSSIVGFAASGGMACSGWPDKPPVNAASWLALDGASIYAALMGAVALLRATTHGRRLDYEVPYHEAAIRTVAPWTRHLHASGRNVGGQGVDPMRCGYGPYPVFLTSDGAVRMVLSTPKQWNALVTVLGAPEELADGPFADRSFRIRNMDALIAIAGAYIAKMATDHVFLEGQRLGLTVTPLYTLRQFTEDEHARSRELFVATDDPEFGELEVTRAPWRTLPNSLMAPTVPAPGLGEDNGRWSTILREQPRTLTPTVEDLDPLRPLEGVRLLQLGSGAVVPEACADVALLGADVIRVESMANPDFLRRAGTNGDPNQSATYNQLNLGVRSLAIDMRESAAEAILGALVAQSDAVVENMRAPVVERWGFDYAGSRRWRDDIVMLSSQGFGAGPYGAFQSFGPNLSAFCGAASQWAHPDDELKVGSTVPHPDHVAGKQAFVVLLAALRRRELIGDGCFIEAAQLEAPVHLMADLFLAQRFSESNLAPRGNRSKDMAPFGCYPCLNDDWVALACETDDQWRRLGKIVNASHPHPERLDTLAGRLAAGDELDAAISAWTSGQAATDVVRALRDAHIPSSVVVDGDVLAIDDGNSPEGLFQQAMHAVVGSLPYSGMPVLTDTGKRPPTIAPPLIGEHTDEILRDLAALDAGQITKLRAAKTVGW